MNTLVVRPTRVRTAGVRQQILLTAQQQAAPHSFGPASAAGPASDPAAPVGTTNPGT